jgi:hydroxymethylglutaryl-CoA reductase
VEAKTPFSVAARANRRNYLVPMVFEKASVAAAASNAARVMWRDRDEVKSSATHSGRYKY